MTPVAPTQMHAGSKRVTFAANQKEYAPLPAAMDANGLVLTEWELSAEDLARLLRGGTVRLWLYTFNKPLQPVWIETVEPTDG